MKVITLVGALFLVATGCCGPFVELSRPEPATEESVELASGACLSGLALLARDHGRIDHAMDLATRARARYERAGARDGLALNAALLDALAKTPRGGVDERRAHAEVATGLYVLPCAAAARAWDVWDRHLDAANATFARSGEADPVATGLTILSARAAAGAAERGRAAGAFALAAAQWRALGRPEEAHRAEVALAGLTPRR